MLYLFILCFDCNSAVLIINLMFILICTNCCFFNLCLDVNNILIANSIFFPAVIPEFPRFGTNKLILSSGLTSLTVFLKFKYKKKKSQYCQYIAYNITIYQTVTPV